MRSYKCYLYLFCMLLFVSSTVFAANGWKNWYAPEWTDTAANITKYAKQMGYDYIAVKGYAPYYKNNPSVAGLNFYIINPYYNRQMYSDLSFYNTATWAMSQIQLNQVSTMSQADQNWYNSMMAWKSNSPFPYNFASGWSSGTAIGVMWDFQQQAVIDFVVNKIITIVQSYEAPGFLFAGFIYDVPKLYGDFNYWNGTRNMPCTLLYWLPAHSSILHGSITHEYSDYRDGVAAFYKQLNTRIKTLYPNAKWIGEPYYLYNTTNTTNPDEWIYQVSSRPDRTQLAVDMLSEEGATTNFVDDARNFNSGLPITKDMVGSSQSNNVDEAVNRAIAGKAGINGAWFNWFGRFGGAGTMPSFQGITAVYPRLKLIRCIPNWDNLNNIPLASRSWNGSIYRSTNSYISNNIMYSRHWKNPKKIFVVFNTRAESLMLKQGETISGIQSVDGFFVENGNAISDFTISLPAVTLNPSVTIPVDSTNGQIMGKGYIITLY